jgi:NADH-quinone oxidoreductase subunit G
VIQIAGEMAPRPIAELMDAINQGKHAFAIALGSELEVDAGEARAALSKLKGLVTIAAHEGPLVKAAHIALPACSWAEADGSYVNKQSIVQRSDKALHRRGDARPGWDLVGQLGRALGYDTAWKSLTELHKVMPAGTYATSPKGLMGLPPGERPPAQLQPSGTIPAEKKPEAHT